MDAYKKSDRKALAASYASVAREYWRSKKVFRYRLKRVEEMSDEEINQKCHWWCKENGMVQDYEAFEKARTQE